MFHGLGRCVVLLDWLSWHFYGISQGQAAGLEGLVWSNMFYVVFSWRIQAARHLDLKGKPCAATSGGTVQQQRTSEKIHLIVLFGDT